MSDGGGGAAAETPCRVVAGCDRFNSIWNLGAVRSMRAAGGQGATEAYSYRFSRLVGFDRWVDTGATSQRAERLGRNVH